jgi:hypothetical protein
MRSGMIDWIQGVIMEKMQKNRWDVEVGIGGKWIGKKGRETPWEGRLID